MHTLFFSAQWFLQSNYGVPIEEPIRPMLLVWLTQTPIAFSGTLMWMKCCKLFDRIEWTFYGSLIVLSFMLTSELSNHSLVMENDCEKIVACLCLRNYPNTPSILPEVWPEVFAKLYNLPDLNVENTLFVHLLVCDIRYSWNIVSNCIRSLYLCLYWLKFVVIVVLPNCDQGEQLAHWNLFVFILITGASSITSQSNNAWEILPESSCIWLEQDEKVAINVCGHEAEIPARA